MKLKIAAALLGIAVFVCLVFVLWDGRETEYGPNKTTMGLVNYRHHTPYSHRPKIGDIPAQTTYASWKIRIQCGDIGYAFYVRGREAYKRSTLNQIVTVTYHEVFRVKYEEVFNQTTQRNEKKEIERESVGLELVSWK